MKYLETEIWTQDLESPELWHGKYGLMLNTAALDEREAYFDITKVSAMPHTGNTQSYLSAH
jgi:hypothetical protein